MGIRTVTQILESPMLANLLVLGMLGSLFFFLRRKDTEGHASSFLATIFLLLIRDVLVSVFGIREIQFIGDVFYFVFVLFVLLLPFSRTKLVLILLALLNFYLKYAVRNSYDSAFLAFPVYFLCGYFQRSPDFSVKTVGERNAGAVIGF